MGILSSVGTLSDTEVSTVRLRDSQVFPNIYFTIIRELKTIIGEIYHETKTETKV